MKEINYSEVIANMKSMINVLEYDSMRSSGKAKLNSQHLHSLYFLVDKYESMTKKSPVVKKEK